MSLLLKAVGRGEIWSQCPWDTIVWFISSGKMPSEMVSSSILVFEAMGLKCVCKAWTNGGYDVRSCNERVS